jgi:hypothetical protein
VTNAQKIASRFWSLIGDLTPVFPDQAFSVPGFACLQLTRGAVVGRDILEGGGRGRGTSIHFARIRDDDLISCKLY